MKIKEEIETKDSETKKDFSSKKTKGTKRGKKEWKRERNDYNLYVLDDKMASDMANLAFNHVSGLPFPMFDETLDAQGSPVTASRNQLPGIIRLSYIPGPGAQKDAASGINLAARQMYAYIRMKNSGARNYEAPDLMQYLLAMEQIYIQYFEVVRAYGSAQTFYYMNRNIPNVIAPALGCDLADIRANAAQYRGQINILAEQINSLPVPKGFKSFQRRVTVASQIFCDSDSLRGGLYCYTASGYYKYNATKYTTGGCLEYEAITGIETLQSKLNRLSDMIQLILNDADMSIMGGDIIKAFGEGGLYTVATIDSTYKTNPIYDENISAQIENSVSLKFRTNALITVGDDNFNLADIYQKDGVLYYQPSTDAAFTTSASTESRCNYLTLHTNPILNSHKANPDYRDVIEWTRNIFSYHDNTVGCGLEWIVGYVMYTINTDGTYDTALFNTSNLITSVNESTVADTLLTLARIAQFDWHPRAQWMTVRQTSADSIAWIGGYTYNMDLKVYVQVNNLTLKNIHDLANYSVYYVKGLY